MRRGIWSDVEQVCPKDNKNLWIEDGDTMAIDNHLTGC